MMKMNILPCVPLPYSYAGVQVRSWFSAPQPLMEAKSEGVGKYLNLTSKGSTQNPTADADGALDALIADVGGTAAESDKKKKKKKKKRPRASTAGEADSGEHLSEAAPTPGQPMSKLVGGGFNFSSW